MGQVLVKRCSERKKVDGYSNSENKKVDGYGNSESKKVDGCGSSESKKMDGCGMEHRTWSHLPNLALHAIAMKLSSPFALCAFAGVCRSWRSVAKSHKSDFIASQPPLLFLLPDIRPPTRSCHRRVAQFPTSHSSSYFRFYSVTENQIYNIGRDQFSPILAKMVSSKDFFILGQSHGYLIASSRGDESSPVTPHIPILMDLCTGKKITFPRCNFTPQRGMLTSPPNSGNSMLILYNVCIYFVLVYLCRLGDSSGRVYVFYVPKAASVPRSVRSAVVHGGMLYVSIMGGEMLVADASGIQAPAMTNMLTVAKSRGIIMLSLGRSLAEVGIHNAFTDVGKLRGGSGGRMIDEIWYEPCASTYSLFWIDAMKEGSLISNVKSLRCAGGDGLWVHPCDMQQLGFKNVM